MIRAILIDDEPRAREVIREYLEEFPQIEIIGECNDGFEGVKAIALHQPDLIFLFRCRRSQGLKCWSYWKTGLE